METKNNFKRTREKLFPDGANWVKVDFHLHSPFVHSFKLPSGINLSSEKDINRLIDNYVTKLKEQEIEICAVTDYQQIRKEWFLPFQKVAADSNIFVFPGIELSVTYGKGMHILLIFEYDSDVETINRYIQSLHRDPRETLINVDRSHIDIQLENKTIRDVIIRIKEKFDALVIFPHPEDKNGLLKGFQLKEAAEVLKYADAIEYISDGSKERLISTGVFDKKTIEERLSIIENSDPKSLDDIGNKQRNGNKRCTYLKLSSASIHAFKIAFQDPALRVRIYNKPGINIDKITSIRIEGSNFLKNVELNFNQELNSFIGGRGVGKSAILESIRYCLDLPIYSEQSFREDFVKNVVGSGGKITITIHKIFGDTYKNYVAERIIGKDPSIQGTELTPEDIFYGKPPIVIGQKELYHLSTNKEFQLNLIDELIGEDVKQKQKEFELKIRELQENAKNLLLLSEQFSKKEQYEQQLKNTLEHIKTFEDLGVAEKMKLNTELNEDDSILNQNLENVKESISNIENAFSELLDSLKNAKNSLSTAKSKEKEILIGASNIFGSFYIDIFQKNNEVKQIINKYRNSFQDTWKNWKQSKSKYDADINNIKKQLSEKGLSPDKYESLVKSKYQLESSLKSFSKIDEQLKNAQAARNKLKEELSQIRHELFKIRKDKIDRINEKLKGRVKLEVEFEENKDKFRENLKSLLSGSKVSSDAIENIIESISIDGLWISKILSEGKENLKEKFNLTDAMSERIHNWFLSDKRRLYELETLFPEDKIKILLKVDESNYKDFDKLSAGQKATALLILLFTQEDRILIIDQPEEDLDNRFIYDDVVAILRSLKEKRQIILATHNANIPVLGDAEQVITLESDNERGCMVRNNGSIDEASITDDIKNIMEGGEEAFKLRIKKYGVSYE